MSEQWMEIEIITSCEAVEPINGILYNTEVQGVTILDSEDVEFKKKHPGDWDYFDEKLLNIKEGAVIKAYYTKDEKFDEYVNYIKESVNNLENLGIKKGPGIITVSEVTNEDWNNNWKKYYKPTKVGSRTVVKPRWEDYKKKDYEVLLDLDPGMAFGTGTHETTRMCIQALERYVDENSTVFDIGTGSGILGIAASKLGAEKVLGVDLDPVAVDAAKENVSYNNTKNMEVRHGDLMEVVEGKANIVVANIMADIIMFLAPGVRDFIKDEGYFISSGIIKARKDDVVKKLIENNFEPIEINNQGEWFCIVAKKH